VRSHPRTRRRGVLGGIIAALIGCSAARAGFAGDRVVLGARFTYFWLHDTRRSGGDGYDNDYEGNYLGSLWGLDARQHYFPSPFLEVRIASSFGVGAAYGQARARTLDWATDEHLETAGDGDLEIRGIQVYAFGRYRTRSRFTPYAQAGWSFYRSHFFESPAWSGPGRRFEVDDVDGWFVAAGCRVDLGPRFGLDAVVSHAGVDDVPARAYLRPNRYRAGAFPMRHTSVGLGATLAF